MRLQLFIPLFFAAVFLSACFAKREEVVVAQYPDNSPKLVKYYQVNNDKSRVLIKEIAYYPKSKPLMEGGYADSLRDGLWRSWYENGNLWSELEYAKGRRHGSYRAFYENGKKRFEGRFEDDRKKGEWVFFDSTGKETSTIIYN